MEYRQERLIVANRNDANFTKKKLGAKNMRKIANKVETALERTETAIFSKV